MSINIENLGAVLFDMDGTLVDSMWMWGEIDREFLEKRGIEYDDIFQAEIEGLSYMETLRYMKNMYPVEESIEEMADIINDMARDKYEFEVTYKPGALDFLKECKKAGIPCGIATSNNRDLIEACDRNLKFSEYISVIKTADEVGKNKPEPDCYLLAARDLNVPPEKCVVFEDIIPGIQAGKAAGMRVYAVKDDYSKDIEDEKRKLTDGFISDYHELLSID